MIYGAIAEKGGEYYTYLSKIFRAIDNVQTEYNWLITAHVCVPESPEVKRLFSEEYCWLSGEELTLLIDREDFLWVWGVLSGFHKDVPLEAVLQYPLPYADGYGGFWKNPLSIQHPLASVEIVPWDSSATLLFSRRKEIVASFRTYFPWSENLALHNKRYMWGL